MPAWVSRLWLRVRATLSRTHHHELRDELQFHLQALEDDYVAGGLSREEASRRAQREFGNLTRIQEASHDLFAFRALEDLAADVRYALRQIVRSRGFAVMAVLSLAIGIGAVTTAFAVIDAFMLRGLRVDRPDRLIAFSVTNSASWRRWPYAYYARWRAAPDRVFEVAATSEIDPAPLRIADAPIGSPRHARLSVVSGNYFTVLGVGVSAGRPLTPLDDARGLPRGVAVISEAFATRFFGRAGAAIGRTLMLHGALFEVVGVAQRGYEGDWIGHPTDVWIPLAMHPAVAPTLPALLDDEWGTGPRWLRVIARVRDDVSIDTARAAANVIYQRFLSEKEARGAGSPQALRRDRAQTVSLLSAATGYAPERERYTRPLLALGAIVAIVLLVSCANFANLLLARSQARSREFAVRLAFGAGRWRLLRQSMTESAVLAVLAGALGFTLAMWSTTLVLKRFAAVTEPLELQQSIDGRSLIVPVACVGVVLLFGIVPALTAARMRVSVPALQRSGRGVGRRRAFAAGRLLLVGQLTLCTIVLIFAGLLLRTVVNLRGQDLGWDRNVLLVSIAPQQVGAPDRGAAALLADLRRLLLALPGVTSVSLSAAHLLDGRAYWIDGSERLLIDGPVPDPGTRWTSVPVGAGFFGTMGVPLVRGRDFVDADVDLAAPVAIVNETLARTLYGSVDVIGRRIGMNKTADLTIVGVVNDAQQVSPRQRGLGVLYAPMRPGSRAVTLAVRTVDHPADAADMIAHAVRTIDKDLAALSVQTLEQVLNDVIAEERLLSAASLSLAVLVIVIACVGLHAVMSYEVVQRTHEIGVRLAMGATKADVVGLVLRQSTAFALLALAAGVPLGMAASAPLSSHLFDVTAADSSNAIAVSAVLLAVTAMAAWHPARGAARTDPVALLHE